MDSGQRKITPKKVIKYLVMLAVAAVLLYFSFRNISWKEFIQGVKNCNWIWIIASMVIGVLEFVVRAIRWKLLLRQIDPESDNRSAYHGVTIGNIANFVFPRAGELVRCGVVATEKKKTTFEGAVGTVVVERAWDLFCLILISIVFAVAFWNSFGSFIDNNILNNLSAKSSATFWMIAILAVIIAAVVLLYVFRRQLSKTKVGGKVVKVFHNLKEGLLSAFKMKEKWSFIILTLLLWLCFWGTSICTIRAFPQLFDLGWSDALFLMLVGGFGWAVPVQGGFGSYHFAVALAASQVYAISWNDGIVFATISHESQALIMIILGVISFVFYSIKKSKQQPVNANNNL
ncbi:MAG: flippase-like domain-containing protein [Bacteroidales bacterium]|nr:flippase-like domain-containing protein [Bacteroidales bacterium]MBR4980409.1 flippase-like domain-containing protein [Bacteroidales bacterium]